MKQLILILLLLLTLNIQAENRVFKTVLRNGLTVIIKEDHVNPLVNIHCLIKTGSIHEEKYIGTGISHYLEHMLFKGTKKRKVGEYAKDLRRMGGSDLNAYTSKDRTVYPVTILSKHFEEGLEAISDIMQNSTIDPKEAKTEKKVIINEINMREYDDPRGILWRQFYETAYIDSPFKFPVIGYEDVFKTVTRDQLYDYYKNRYAPNNCILAIVGDINKHNALDIVKKYFGNWKRQIIIDNPMTKDPKQVSSRFSESRYNVKNSKGLIVFKTPGRVDKKTPALNILAKILVSGNLSRFIKTVKDEKQLVHKLRCRNDTFRELGEFYIEFDSKDENLFKAKKEMMKIIKSINRTKIDLIGNKYLKSFRKDKIKYEYLEREYAKIKTLEQELKRAVKLEISRIRMSNQHLRAQCAFLIRNEFVTGNYDYDNIYVDQLKKLTVYDIVSASREYLNDKNMTFTCVRPLLKNKKEIKKAKKYDYKKDIETVTLKNGVKLVLYNDKSKDLININATMLAGSLLEDKNTSGLTTILKDLFILKTKNLTKDELSNTLENNGMYLYSKSDKQTMFINFSLLKNDYKLAIELLSDVLNNPKFDETDFEKIKNVNINILKNKQLKVFDMAKILKDKNTFQNHPYSNSVYGNIETLKKLKISDLNNFYNKIFKKSNLVITVAGNFNKKSIINEFNRRFSYMKKEKSEIVKNYKMNKIKKQIIEKYNINYKKQSVILISFQTPKIGHKDNVTLNVIYNFMSGIGSRLFRNLRGKKSLAYSVGCFNSPLYDAGNFVFYIITSKEKRKLATKLLLKEIEILKNSLPSDEEINRGITNFIGKKLEKNQTFYDISNNLSKYSLFNLGLNYNENLIKEIQKVTKEDVKRVAKKYFNMNSSSTVIVETLK